MAPSRKPAAKRQRRGTPELAAVTVLPVPSSPVPPSDDWLPEVVAGWDALWSSPLASVLQETDHPAIQRLFEWRDQLARLLRLEAALRDQALEEPMVEGSKQQPVASPLFSQADAAGARALQIENRIVALEDRLGLSPKARLNIGVTQQQGISLAARNAQLAAVLKEAMSGEAPDPRSLPGDPAEHAR